MSKYIAIWYFILKIIYVTHVEPYYDFCPKTMVVVMYKWKLINNV